MCCELGSARLQLGGISTFFASIQNMAVAGLFAGIGGFELGFSQAGFETRLLAEIDPVARAVLTARFPDVQIHADVGDLEGIPPEVTILTAGFPCQNLSMAGDKSGIRGSKSSVVTKMFELIKGSRVPTVVIENVYFMLQLDAGGAMEWLAEQFEDLGYTWAYRVVNTMAFGLPHRRRRVYFVASREIDPRTVLFADDAPAFDTHSIDLTHHAVGFYWTEGRSGVGFTIDGIPPLKVGSAIGLASAPAVLFPDGEVLMPSLAACERLQGFPTGWTVVQESESDRRSGWRMIGNAVSVPVARWVAERIRTPSPVLDFPLTPLHGGRWPNAAWGNSSERVGVLAGDRPILTPILPISRFREFTWSRLSDRALDGFVRRAREGRLKMPEGFLEALENAPRKPLGTATH